MVYKLKPLELGLDFKDRVYELGDTIDVQVALTPNGDVDARGGRVDLVCEERYIQTGTTFVPDTYAQMSRAGSVTSGQTRDVATARRERGRAQHGLALGGGPARRWHPKHTYRQALDSADASSAFRGG